MLYYYITSPLKKQGVQRIFFTFRKNRRKQAVVFAIATEKSKAAPASGTAMAFCCCGAIMPAQAHRRDMYLCKRRSRDMYLRR